jgi:molybdopterin synthase sulfur carrier subunit
MTATIRVELPSSLCALAGVGRELLVTLNGPATQRSLLDALEADFPVLRGTIRDHASKQRRPFVRFFACEQDLSHCSPDQPLPMAVAEGREIFMALVQMAGPDRLCWV